MARRKASGGSSAQSAKRPRVSGAAGDEEKEVVMVERRTQPEGEEAEEEAEAEAEAAADADPPRRRSNPRRTAAIAAAAATAEAAAAEAATAAVPSADEIHERAFARITTAERDAWQGWTDIESEPAFFNFILGELGIQGATIQEVFSVDEASADYLPNPGGLIFLYRFVEEAEEDVREDCPDELWFANQTTSNACATIAMLNIAMNCPGLRLGDVLTRFKAATQHLHPALRGHLLSSHALIRSKHNSFARRLDMLTSDIALKHEWTEAERKRRRARARKSSSRSGSIGNENGNTKKKISADDDEAAFHFIAYVPMGQDVWELNGMQNKGLRLGSFTRDWTAMARERIAARMLAYSQYDDRAVFSLLALCQTGVGPDGGPDRSLDEDVARAAARRSDYTPAVHSWIKKLADKGVLRRLATGEAEERGE
ncbi:ubiquitin carboxyl-terminal hydrolase [Grosmannia clavigera kw1407]|uniref:ubiquitinyl hydrolase 1 n=1 Tax=Grosmannia clavigera (strain kw1407 / UAMH 11150) TaxID=655863 RepID=F0XR82_GROCL|nr:ubiquitin carboxyl-terminal hydrolase [Grosmannia clavigera kw1407]EFW99842.1 ubiquitin carboxyl-terminal hydrolase [Grosmannia clavigera kw1407]